MTQRNRTPLAAALCLTLAAAGTAQADTLRFQQGLNGYSGQADTGLRGTDPDTPLGSEAELSIDASDGGLPSQALLRFDGVFGNAPGQITPGSSIVSATLTLNISSAGSGLRLHELLRPFNAATITWNSAVGGIQADGVEAAAAALISLGANDGSTNIGAGTLVIDFTAALQRVQSGAAPGLGWALLPWTPDGTNGVDFYSAEWVELAERPLLTVQTLPVPEPAGWALSLFGLGGLFIIQRMRARPQPPR